MPPKVKAITSDLTKGDAKAVIARGRAVIAGMGTGTGPTLYPAPTVPIDTLKTAVDTLDTLTTESMDGSRKIIAQRDKQKHAVVRMLEQNAHYVEDNCKDDVATFVISGFVPKPNTKNPPQPLPPAKIISLKYGNSTEIVAELESQGRSVLHYQVRFGEVGAGGTAPTTWTTEDVTKGQRKTFKISGLKPGTIYAFQARALGPLGFTEWTDSVTKMAT
jgi:hypothetical protein